MALFSTLYHKISQLPQSELALKATLILFLFSEWISGSEWVFYIPIVILSAIGLLIKDWFKNKFIWYGLSFFFVIKTISYWWVQDNHLFVNTYWVIAIAFSLSFSNYEKILAENARVMIGLIFLFATVWKFLSPDFISGSFFHYTFLTDLRFAEESKIIAAISRADLMRNISELEQVKSGLNASALLYSNPAVKLGTQLVTWHTIIIESMLAFLFLLPGRFKASRLRNFLLILFSLTTYLTMPIHSFAWLLIAVCISQTRSGETIDRFILVCILPLMLIFKHVPFMEWLAGVF